MKKRSDRKSTWNNDQNVINVTKTINPHIQEGQRPPKKRNIKETTPTHIKKLSCWKHDKEKDLRAVRGKKV